MTTFRVVHRIIICYDLDFLSLIRKGELRVTEMLAAGKDAPSNHSGNDL